ncbi:MAG: hypothetical protein IKU43_01215 [Clostridia bacterium]|nr:hypothetical protein [Clostridia bacterium]
MSTITITNNICGQMRKLHGVNCAPHAKGSGINQGLTKKIFTYCGTPHSRLHDCMGTYGGTYFIDVPNIFRDFDADENDPASYDFYYSDEYIQSIINCGTQIVYRLGVTIEWGTKKYSCHPPKDFAKWARICEHIIMHYNEGWAGGFKFGIEYWEIWNEPENPPMWTGTREEFYELYRVASTHLKSRFPHLKIGGYGSCGFYAVFREGLDDFYKSFIPYFEDFLVMCRDNDCPLDFYSWHIYTPDVTEIEKSHIHVRTLLDKYGFTDTESHLNEWNYGGEGQGFDKLATIIGASFCASSLCCMQNIGVDLAQYYCLSRMTCYNGFIDLRTAEFTPVIHVFAAFNRIYGAGNQVELKCDNEKLYSVAASDGDFTVGMISNYNNADDRIEIKGIGDSAITLYSLSENGGFEKLGTYKGDVIARSCNNSVLYFIVSNEGAEIPEKYSF